MFSVVSGANGEYNIGMDLGLFFRENNRAAVAFSGGVDSSYLLYAAAASGADVTAYYARSQFQPEFELEDARAVAELAGAEMKVIDLDVLADGTITSNPEDRCYHCKLRIMGSIIREASADGYGLIIDGTNASDDTDDRPGTRALRELGVRSPLRECGITKDEVRRLSREAGLPVWDKPAYACLATRIPHGEKITAEKLARTERAETIMSEMGFRDFRVRMRGDKALIQVPADQYDKASGEMEEIRKRLSGMYSRVDLDSVTR